MTLSIGTNIRDLRTKYRITQEQLATFLGVTSQAVSRWEGSIVYPDIEMLPSIAEYFGVTIDCLLGIDRDEKERRRLEIYLEIEKGYETGKNSGEEAIRTARQYAAEFPSDGRIELNLADTVSRTYMWATEPPDLDRLSEAEKLYQTIIDTTSDDTIRYKATEGLAALYAVAYKDEQKTDRVLRRLPAMHYSAECIGSRIAEWSGISVGRTQDYIEKLTDSLCMTLEEYVIGLPNGSETWDEKVGMFEQLISIYHFVFGNDLLFYHSRVAELYRVIATYKVAQNRYDETIRCLEKMTFHLKEGAKAKPGDKYTSPFTDTLSYPEDDPLKGGFHNPILHNEAWYVLNEKLTQSRYDPIRDAEGFRAVVEELNRIAK